MPPYGNGADGPFVADAGTVTVDSTLSPFTGSKGSTEITLTSPVGFGPGKVLFLHQSQGAGAGVWEMNRITSISGGNALVALPLAHTYTTGGSSYAQAVVLPQYTTVTVHTGATVVAPAWNGSVGGILAFQAQTSAQVDGALVMDGRGFRGGVGGPTSHRGYSGEGETSASVNSQVTSNASGGGAGADCSQNVSGPGGHATGGGAGAGVPCISSGGAAGTDAPDLSVMLFGGGGGGPGNDASLAGGAGGGIVYVATPALHVTGSISSGGHSGTSAATTTSTACSYAGAGGDGAGGSIYLMAASGALSKISALAPTPVTLACKTTTLKGGQAGNGRIHLTGGLTGTTTPTAQ
jgi:hypothetical protein